MWRGRQPTRALPHAGLADCLAGFIEALALEQPRVLGMSFGSGLAPELYHWRPHDSEDIDHGAPS